MRKTAALLLLILAACATPSAQCIRYIECPDGMADCQEQAKELCPKGYSLMNDADVGPDFSDFAKANFAGASAGVPHIVASCNP